MGKYFLKNPKSFCFTFKIYFVSELSNPFNPSTKINFTLPSQSFVSLKVYDLLGRELATLLNSEIEAGEHVVNWDASNRESGVYVYRIVTENHVETRKMLLAK
ncbi:MAG: T9SS type A sorting domain-containing protein [Ignavibacteriae bacterium]|nr:T9SS type A sorting domain-containing protein [Ignavibacteriota bacterium]